MLNGSGPQLLITPWGLRSTPTLYPINIRRLSRRN